MVEECKESLRVVITQRCPERDLMQLYIRSRYRKNVQIRKRGNATVDYCMSNKYWWQKLVYLHCSTAILAWSRYNCGVLHFEVAMSKEMDLTERFRSKIQFERIKTLQNYTVCSHLLWLWACVFKLNNESSQIFTVCKSTSISNNWTFLFHSIQISSFVMKSVY